MMKEDWVYRRGDIYFANLDPVVGSEQGGYRPVVVVQNDIGNKHSPTIIVVTVTSKVNKKANMPTHFLFRNNPAFRKASMVQMEHIYTIDKSKIDSKYEYLCYAQYISDYVINGEKSAALTVKTGDDTKKVKFDGYGFYKMSIKPENIDKTVLISKDGLGVCLLYSVKTDK